MRVFTELDRAGHRVVLPPMREKRHERHGPVQSNGMCLLEFVVQWNLKPNSSTEQIVDLPQVTSCPGPVSEPGAFMSCGYFPPGSSGRSRLCPRPSLYLRSRFPT